MRVRRYGRWLASGTMLGIAAMPAGAQQVPAGALHPPTREEVQRAQQAPAATPVAPTLDVEGGVPRTPCPLSEGRFQNVQITLKEADFDGLEGMPPEALRETYQAFIGHPEPISIVCQIRDAADAALSRAGYIAAIRVPPQRIDAGVVHFEVVMAHVVALRVRGDAGASERRIAQYLKPIQEQKVFNAHEAVRYLLLASDLPGYQVRLALRPADDGKPGDVIGEISVSHQIYSIDFDIQDMGSRSVGRWGGLARATFFGLTGMGDQTQISFFSTSDFDEQKVVQVSHGMRLGSEGLSVGGNFTYAWTHPTIPQTTASSPRLDIRANTLVGNMEMGYPFVRSQTVNVRGAAGFDYIDQDVRISGNLLSRDHMRIGYLRLNADTADTASVAGVGGYSQYMPKWRVAGSIEFRQGLDIFDATQPCGSLRCRQPGAILPSRLAADPTPTIFRLTGSAEYRPMPKMTLAFLPRGQYASHALLSYEQFSGGSYTIGRGFDPGTVLGDSGVGFQAEVRYGSTAPRTAKSFALEPYAFVDSAWAWNHDVDPTQPGLRKESLTSLGGGVRAAYGDRFRLDASLAVPVHRDGSDGDRRVGDVRFLVSLVARLLP